MNRDEDDLFGDALKQEQEMALLDEKKREEKVAE